MEPGPSVPPSSPSTGVQKGPFDCVKKLTHTQVKRGWREAYSSGEKRPYYYNIFTRESVWSIPDLPDQREESQADAGPAPDLLAAAMSELSDKPNAELSEPPYIKGKKRKFSPDPDQEKNDMNAVRFQIGGERYVYIKRFKGHFYVNIREYYFNENKTKLLAGKKGLNLTAEEWLKLSEQSQAITQAMEIV